MFVLVLFELPTFCLHSFIRNWVVLNKEDDESFFSLPLLLCFGEIDIDYTSSPLHVSTIQNTLSSFD